MADEQNQVSEDLLDYPHLRALLKGGDKTAAERVFEDALASLTLRLTGDMANPEHWAEVLLWRHYHHAARSLVQASVEQGWSKLDFRLQILSTAISNVSRILAGDKIDETWREPTPYKIEYAEHIMLDALEHSARMVPIREGLNKLLSLEAA